MPESTWHPLGGVLVLLLARWVPVVLGFGEPFAAAVMLMNVALGAYAWKMLARNAES